MKKCELENLLKNGYLDSKNNSDLADIGWQVFNIYSNTNVYLHGNRYGTIFKVCPLGEDSFTMKRDEFIEEIKLSVEVLLQEENYED